MVKKTEGLSDTYNKPGWLGSIFEFPMAVLEKVLLIAEIIMKKIALAIFLCVLAVRQFMQSRAHQGYCGYRRGPQQSSQRCRTHHGSYQDRRQRSCLRARCLPISLSSPDWCFKPEEMGQGSIAIVMVTAELGPFDRLRFKNRCYGINNRRCGEPSGRNAVSHSAYRP